MMLKIKQVSFLKAQFSDIVFENLKGRKDVPLTFYERQHTTDS